MKEYKSNYGEITGITQHSLHPNGNLKECVVEDRLELNTSVGILVPQYEYAEIRKKNIYGLSFYESGALRRISLNDQTEIITSMGPLRAELITFYESGSIKRVFPLNGQMSAYWEEHDEYLMAKKYEYEFAFGKIDAKIMVISFYEQGEVKDVTLWPKEVIAIQTPIGEQKVKIGVSLYPDGSIKSLEPKSTIEVPTAIGNIKAYDINSNGISGDLNSLNFTQEGTIKSLITSHSKITVLDDKKNVKEYSPEMFYDVDGCEVYFRSLKVEFKPGFVRLNGDSYAIENHLFRVNPYIKPLSRKCEDGASCESCMQ